MIGILCAAVCGRCARAQRSVASIVAGEGMGNHYARQVACVLLLLLACACVCAAVPERPRFRIIGSSQGLPSTDIKALVRDQDGYLWIGTADGLARHDGGMRVWRHDPDAQQGLPGNNAGVAGGCA